MYSGVMPQAIHHRKSYKNEINYSSKMKKNYEKPCCSSMVVAVEQPMLAGSPGAANQNYNQKKETELNSSTAGGSNPAKIGFFQDEDFTNH